MRSVLALMLFATIGAAPVVGHTLQGTLLVDGLAGGMMEPGQGSRWTVAFRDPESGEQVTQFDLTHEKSMHLIVVSEDLSTFAHVHPGLAPSTGVFTIDVNQPTEDPDNQDAARVVTRSGRHFLFGEIKPAGHATQLHRFTVQAAGDDAPDAVEPDLVDADGKIVKAFDSGYRVSLKPEAMKHDMLHLGFHVERRAEDGGYVPVEDLEPWLGMTGHAVLIGAAGATVGDRVFRHLHAGHGDHHARGEGTPEGAGPDFMFMLHGAEVPPHGVYRVWLQVKRQGRVLTFPFTFRV